MGRKKQVKAAKAAATIAETAARRAMREEKRSAKREHRKRDKKVYTADQWAIPAPRHLVARLDAPKHKSKYQSYFEFAENTEKKEKKLEYKVTNDANPPPGFVFVPIGDPTLTTACKELSRERDAMIFIVSTSKEQNSKISEHIYRTGYHFREVIVEEARRIVGEFYVPKAAGDIEPIPESQEEINKQADAAIRDLFPRIPNTDRQMIIEHAFQKGALFHGEPTVGLQTNIPLSRRVQLAVLAHIRHTHTRYDKLLRETSWMNARKVVEPVCLDVLVKWRGDEETGRDQMDEILREVVIITDSEDEEDTSDTDDTSTEEGEVTSASSSGGVSQRVSHTQQNQADVNNHTSGSRPPEHHARRKPAVASNTLASVQLTPGLGSKLRDKRAQRGFRRYQAAWEDALHRRRDPSQRPASSNHHSPFESEGLRRLPAREASPSSQKLHSFSDRTSHIVGHSHARFPETWTRIAGVAPHYLQPEPIFPARNSTTMVRPSTENTFHELHPSPNLAPYPSVDSRPSQLMKDSTTNQGLQDLLVPSIEPSSSEGVASSQRIYERHDIHHRQPHIASLSGHSRLSPNRRNVIVIDDDSPQFKRRRVVHETASPHLIPVSLRDQVVRGAVTYSEPHAVAVSSNRRSDMIFRPSEVAPPFSQGLYNEPQPRDRIPVHTRPLSGGHAELPDQMRRANLHQGSVYGEGHRAVRRWTPDPPRGTSVDPVYYRPVRIAEPAHIYDRREADFNLRAGNLAQRSVASTSTFSDGASYAKAPGSAVADQPFVHRFSESKLEHPLPQIRDGLIIFPERARDLERQSTASYGYENQPSRSYAALRPVRASSPGRFVQEGYAPYSEERRQPIFYDISNSNRPVYSQLIQRQPKAMVAQPRYPPQDVASSDRDPSRHVIVLE